MKKFVGISLVVIEVFVVFAMTRNTPVSNPVSLWGATITSIVLFEIMLFSKELKRFNYDPYERMHRQERRCI